MDWRYTWEAQSHIPRLRLLLFCRHVNPSCECLHLNVQLLPSLSLLAVSWQWHHPLSLIRVPIPPRVLLDFQSPPSFRAFHDHIEVNLLLLLPVDHPILSSFHSHHLPTPSGTLITCLFILLALCIPSLISFFSCLRSTKPIFHTTTPFLLHTLLLQIDYKSSQVVCVLPTNFLALYLSRLFIFSLFLAHFSRRFVEMPSANWREVADNWFGACCCSFGGISEKLVIKYANSYTCAPGVCLFSPTSITLSTDDLIQYDFPERGGQECNSKSHKSEEINKAAMSSDMSVERSSTCNDIVKPKSSRLADSENESLRVNSGHIKSNPNCAHRASSVPILENEDWQHQCCENDRKEHIDTTTVEVLASQKSFLNGFLEDVFMARPSNLSRDIDWREFTCPQCNSVLGAYPCCKGDAPVDGGVRLFKCNISTCLPARGSGDLFRQYSMEKMFANKLVECANDESSFRFVVIDLKAKSPALQITLINPDTWSISGDCYITEDSEIPKLQLQPVIKVLFSECSTATEFQLRRTEEWITNNSAESIFMLTCQIKELVASLMLARDVYPPSCASLQGLCLSYLQR